MPVRFRANAPAVVSEVIDGEAVIMNLVTGKYISATGVAATLWQWLERGVSDEDASAALAAHFSLEPDAVRTAIAAAVTVALGEQLLVEETSTVDMVPDRSLLPTQWSTPEFTVYSDMSDLLLLDPIHDVGEQGWPSPRAA
ncbi:MAG: PqqD family protein [Gemmatimonadaceae bacterium]|jgi:hypothetical protein|nr:PqqD family protein [Gemmatimonadaceae bacterium]